MVWAFFATFMLFWWYSLAILINKKGIRFRKCIAIFILTIAIPIHIAIGDAKPRARHQPDLAEFRLG